MMTVDDRMIRKLVPSAANGAVRLRRVKGGRRHAVKLLLDDAEYDAIAARAADCKLSVQRFLVSCALTRRGPMSNMMGTTLGARAPSALIAELVGLRRLAANLANNINQIARVLNSGGMPDASIPAAADAVRRVMARLDSALAGMAADRYAWPPVRSVCGRSAPSADRGSCSALPPSVRIAPPEAPS